MSAPADIPAYEWGRPRGMLFWQEAATRTFHDVVKGSCDLLDRHLHPSSGGAGSQSRQAEFGGGADGHEQPRLRAPHESPALPVIEDAKSRYVVYGPLATVGFRPRRGAPICPRQPRSGSQRGDRAHRPGHSSRAGPSGVRGRPSSAQSWQRRAESGMLRRARLPRWADRRVSLWALPAGKLDRYCAEIATLARANQTLTKFHLRRREDVEAGKRPTVRQSLERLSS